MKTIRTKVYQFSELSKAAKQTAIEQLKEINVQFDWWACTFEDAQQAGIIIDTFDLDKRQISGSFETSAGECVEYILENHGKQCQTYKTAHCFKNAFQLPSNETNEDELSDKEDEFLNFILQDYLDLLQEQLDYEYSDAAVIDTIEANEYDFTKDGKRFNR